MPLTVAISTTRRVWWWTRRATFRRELPESWKDVPATRRRRWLSWWLDYPADAQKRITRDALRLPGWAWRAMGDAERQALQDQFRWTQPTAQCTEVPIEQVRHKGRTYCFPTAKGQNMTAIEYAAAEDYYKAVDEGDERSLLLLAATLWRERDADHAAALRRGDVRVPLFDKAEAEDRAERLKDAPPEMLIQALLYFVGLKVYMHRVYRTWLFESNDDDDDEQEEDDSPATPNARPPSDGPDFGLWGAFQWVAEVGVFGVVKEVYQTPIHEVFVFMVRKRIEAERMKSAYSTPQGPKDFDDHV